MKRHLEKAHRDGQLCVPSERVPPKQVQQQPQPQRHQHETQQEVLPVVAQTPDQQQSFVTLAIPTGRSNIHHNANNITAGIMGFFVVNTRIVYIHYRPHT